MARLASIVAGLHGEEKGDQLRVGQRLPLVPESFFDRLSLIGWIGSHGPTNRVM